MKHIQIEEHPDLVRDLDSKAIKIVDNEGLLQYKRKKSSLKQIKSMEDRINTIEDKFTELQSSVNSNKETLDKILELLNDSIRK